MIVNRLNGEFDPGVSLWQGDLSGVPLSDWTDAQTNNSLPLLVWADDERPASIPGPFGDPLLNFNVVDAGVYTLLVCGVCSAADADEYAYEIVVRGSTVPAPGIAGLLALAGIAAAGRRRRA